MLDHVTLKVGDFARARDFYDRALTPLGLGRLAGDGATFGGCGADRPFFWIGAGDASDNAHVAFVAGDRAAVDAFYAAAVAAGGRDNGVPGPRASYGPDYYAAFVIDFDGHNIEAVCRKPG